MKKSIIPVFVAIMILFCSTLPLFAFSADILTPERDTSVPTVPWNLTVTNSMAAQGIDTDWANRMGNYPYSAYVTGNMVYSNYYFIPQNPHKFVLYGRTMFPVTLAYAVRMVSYSNSSYFCVHGISPQTSNWSMDYYTRGYTFGQSAYFGINGAGSGVTVSVEGTMTTY